MDFILPEIERNYLRELAKKQAEYAVLPIMDERKQMWYDLNDGKQGAVPPVVVETWTWDRDFLPGSVFRCISDLGKSIEYQLLRNIRNYELINDDKVMPDFFEIYWIMKINEFGIVVDREIKKDSQGYDLGFRYLHPIKNLKEDFHLLKPAVCKVDKKQTFAFQAFLIDLFGDILKIVIQTNILDMECTDLTNRAIQLMGMEAFYMAMIEQPEEVQRLMAYISDNALAIYRWAESEGLLIVNNGNQDSFGTSFNFTHLLPAPGYKGGPARLCDFWAKTNGEETVGISPEMYKEFCLPAFQKFCEPMGLVYYGCCEAVHTIWDHVKQVPNIKKVSISAWCDVRYMGDALRGSKIVFSRKPDPHFIGVDVELDEAAWSAYIRETLEATKGVFTEFIFRDVYTVHGNINKMRRGVELAKKEIAKYY